MRAYSEYPSETAWISRRLPEVYLVVALFVCGLLSVVTAPFDVPDEPNHVARELQIAHGELLAHRTTQGVGGAIDENLQVVASTMSDLREAFPTLQREYPRSPKVTPAQLRQLEALHWSGHTVSADFPNTAVYPPGLYLPQVLGWKISQAADLTIVHSLMLARLCATICAIVLGWLALRMAGSERWFLFPYLLLPTGLSLSASCSQDALLAPLTALFAVLLLRAVARQRPQRNGELLLSSFLLALMIGARVTYLPLVLVLLLPAIETKPINLRRFVKPLIAIVLVLVAVGGWQIAVRPLGVVIHPGANPAQQLALLEHHPRTAILSLLDTIFRVIPRVLTKSVYLLGWNDIGAPGIVTAAMVLGMGIFALIHPLPGLRTRPGKLVLLLTLAGMITATWMAEYLLWTDVGALHVEGLQGRYFFPIIPFALLLGWTRLPARLRAFRPELQPRLSLGAAIMFLPAVLAAPWAAAHAFYRSGVIEALTWLTR